MGPFSYLGPWALLHSVGAAPLGRAAARRPSRSGPGRALRCAVWELDLTQIICSSNAFQKTIVPLNY